MSVSMNYDRDGDNMAVTIGHIEGLTQCTVMEAPGEVTPRVCLEVMTLDGTKLYLAIHMDNAADLYKGLGIILRRNVDPTSN